MDTGRARRLLARLLPSIRVPRTCGAFILAVMFVATAALAREEVSLGEMSLVVRRWGVDAGLTGTRSDAVAQTPDGYLWVGNVDGLFRFNGRRFDHFTVSDWPERGHRWISRLCVDAKGLLWLATTRQRVGVYSGGVFNVVSELEDAGELLAWAPQPEGGVVACFKKDDHVLFAALDPEQFNPLSNPVSADIGTIHVSSDHRIWVALRSGPLVELRAGALKPGAPGPVRNVGAFLQRRDGSLLAFGLEGVFAYDGDSWFVRERFPEPLSRKPQFAIEDSAGRVWFGSPGGACLLWDEGRPLRRLLAGRGSIPGVVPSAIHDAEGNLWFASFSGLFQVRHSPFVTWTPPRDVTTERVVSVGAGPDGSVWFSCFGALCRLAPGTSDPVVEVKRPLSEVTFFAVDAEQSVWFGNKDGYFARRDASGETRIPVRTERSNLVPTGFAVAPEGVAWLAAHAGIFRCDPREEPLEFVLASGRDGLPAAAFQGISVDHDGNLLTIAKGNGVFRGVAGGDSWHRLSPPGDTVAQSSGPLSMDAEERLWGIAPGPAAIGCWRDGQAWHGALADLGFGPALIAGIAADDDGGLWFATRNQGVARADREQLFAALRDSTSLPPLTWFDTASGLGSKGGSFADNCIQKMPDGKIWVATEAGVSAIDPKRWRVEQGRATPPRVHVEECLADGEPLPVNSPVVVPAGTSRVLIRYSTSSFGFPGEMNYRHRLRGLDDVWMDAGNADEAYFQKLRPGRYEFEVTAANRYRKWNPQPASLALLVAPYWWQRAEAQIAGAALLILVLAAFVRARLAGLRKREQLHAAFSRQIIHSQEQERKRIAGELHDGLGQDLLAAKNLALLGVIKPPPAGEVGQRFKEISDTLGGVINEARNISRALRPAELDNLGLTKALQAMLQRLDASTEIAVETEIHDVDHRIAHDDEIHFYRLIQESLNNVIRHSRAGRLQCRVTHDSESVRAKISDNGRGFNVAEIRQQGKAGLGLRSMEERARLMGGQLHFHSAPGHGTHVIITLPIARKADE